MNSFERIKDYYFYHSISVIIRKTVEFCIMEFQKNTYLIHQDELSLTYNILRNNICMFTITNTKMSNAGDQAKFWDVMEKFVNNETILFKLELLQE